MINAYLNNNIGFSVAAGDTYYQYNGVDQYSFVADNAALDVNNAATDFWVMGWTKADNSGLTNGLFGKYSTSSIDGRYGFTKNGSNVIRFLFETSDGTVLVNTPIDGDADTDLHHFAARIDISGLTIYVYVDGVLINAGGTAFTGTFATLDNKYKFYIGTAQDSEGDAVSFADTQFRDIRIYLMDVTSELTNIINGKILGTEKSRWALGLSGSSDLSGNGYNLTDINSPTIIS